MSERIHALAQLLPGKASLEECSIEELQHLIKRYPYFAPAQFLLLQKLKAAGSADYEAQHRKAVLYFHDPLLFDQFISSDRFYVDETAFSPSTKQTTHEQEKADLIYAEPNVSVDEETSLPDRSHIAEPLSIEEPVEEPQTFFAAQPNLEQTETRIPHKIDVPDESASLPVEIVPADEAVHAYTEAETDQRRQEEPTAINDMPVEQEQNREEMKEGENLFQELVNEENVSEPSLGPVAVAETLTAEGQRNKPDENLPENTGGTTLPATPRHESPLFEPYHMVDYFASQGIKITAEELPKDKLGKQLRSFTEWLKVMKRLPATDMARTPESPAEKNVETLASHSVVESDVITEAMAEVWIKQGNREKAIETYNKLSLLNPSKKAYFAAKIENLKGS